MSKRIIKFASLAFLFIVFLFACQTDFDIFERTDPKQELMEAKLWYDSQNKEMLSLRAEGDSKDPKIIPDWESYLTGRDSEYKTVELSIKSEYFFAFYSPDCLEKYEETNDTRWE